MSSPAAPTPPSNPPDPVRFRLGVDGLPLGDRAAVAVADRIVAELVVPAGEDRSVLDRVRDAHRLAAEQVGAPPVDVRLVALDDRTDGSRLVEIENWLASRGARFVVLDPAVITLAGPELSDGAADDSSLRARAAALW
jgi:hypothetical protein